MHIFLIRLEIVNRWIKYIKGSFCFYKAPPLSKKGKVKSFNERLIETAKSLLVSKGESWSVDLERDIPSRWQCHGDMVLFGDSCFSNTIWRQIGEFKL